MGVHIALCEKIGDIGDCAIVIWFAGERDCLRMGGLAMDNELRARIAWVVRQLAEGEQKRLRVAGTLIELEEIACEIGDEVTRQLLKGGLVERSNEVAEASSQACPDCGQSTTHSELHHRQLESTRGEIEYFEPAYHCPSCRRAFFPGSAIDRLVRASHGDPEADGEDRVGGEQPQQLRDGRGGGATTG